MRPQLFQLLDIEATACADLLPQPPLLLLFSLLGILRLLGFAHGLGCSLLDFPAALLELSFFLFFEPALFLLLLAFLLCQFIGGGFLLLFEIPVRLALHDCHIEGAALDFNGALAFADEDMHHKVAHFLRSDLELNQAVISSAHSRCGVEPVGDSIALCRLVILVT